MPAAVLYAYLQPEPSAADGFFDWYESEHVPGRLAVPGFRSVRRFRPAEPATAAVVLYELDGPDVLASDAYRAVQARTADTTRERMGALQRFDRVTATVLEEQGTVGGAAHAFVVGFAVPQAAEGELDRWYREEHVPLLLAADGWDGIRLLSVEETNTPLRRLAVHELSDLAALDSPERAAASSTPWRTRLASEPWFATSQRILVRAVDELAGNPAPGVR
jgi:hypothetical protein